MKYIKNILYILSTVMAIFIFATCKDELGYMQNDNEPSYTIYVSRPDTSSTRATYDDRGAQIAVKWEKGDFLTMTYNGNSYRFFYRESYGDVGAFVHYGDDLPMSGNDKTFQNGAMLYFGNETDGGAVNIQTQKKNNECREYLQANLKNMRMADISINSPVALMPVEHSLLHIKTKSPAAISGKSMLRIKGLDKEYKINLGDDPEISFVQEGDSLDVYVIVPTNLTITDGTALKFYLYSHDKYYDEATDGDEYHYYMTCKSSSAFTAEKKSVIKIKLPDKPTHTAIQMGLPSGRKWATENIGASSNTEAGLYFWWGDIVGYNMATAHNFAKNVTAADTWEKTGAQLKAEGIIGADYNLVPERDAAVQHWGEEWKMPNARDFNELTMNCDWDFKTIDGMRGYYAVSNKNNKSIFFSAAGYRNNNDVTNDKTYYNQKGFYRSSSMSIKGNQKAFGIMYTGVVHEDGDRSTGLPIRPVIASYSNPVMTPEIEGVLSGVFTVDKNGTKVRFSKGNMQYRASDNTWRFAEHQYDVVGKDNEKFSPTYDGWIDLFNWGTAGWNSGAKYYLPYQNVNDKEGYWPGNDPYADLTGDYARADWGYNAISNGGNKEGQWRTPNGMEFYYIIQQRPNYKNLATKAIVGGVYGVMLFPDDWYNQYDIPIQMQKFGAGDFSINNFSLQQWEVLENSGAVFLPTAGFRNPDNVFTQLDEDLSQPNAKRVGAYWTCSAALKRSGSSIPGYEEKCQAKNFRFGTDNSNYQPDDGGWYRHSGHSVRVIRNVEYKY